MIAIKFFQHITSHSNITYNKYIKIILFCNFNLKILKIVIEQFQNRNRIQKKLWEITNTIIVLYWNDLSNFSSLNNNFHLGGFKFPNEEFTESMEESLKHLMEIHFLHFQKIPSKIWKTKDKNIKSKTQLRTNFKPRKWSPAEKLVYSLTVKNRL